MAQSKAESFTAYLEAKQQRKRAEPPQQTGGGTALSILAVLAGSGRDATPLPDLQAASGMSFTDFAEAVKRLQDSGYLTIAGAPGSETAQLTKLGQDVAALARPA
jgi:hypothetical protein